MLVYRFDRVFKARSIDKPFAFLKKAGLSHNFASKIKNNRVTNLDIKQLERLCLLFRCTPNDIIEWVPDEDSKNVEDHPLNELKRIDFELEMVKTINSVPLSKMKEINALIKEELKK